MAAPDTFGAWQQSDAATLEEVAKLSASGVQRIKWQGKNSCDHCIINDGVVRQVGTPFPNGALLPPAHPNCQCVIEKEGVMSQAHPGFKAAAKSIQRKSGVSADSAARILAASSRNASAKAKRANPRLKRVAGKKAS